MAAPLSVSDDFRKLGLTYWQRLVQVGVPKEEAQAIATAIAKYDLLHRVPSLEQKQLISKFSRFLCRANLWRGSLLL